MKKLKLTLNTETIARLNDHELNNIVGGEEAQNTFLFFCKSHNSECVSKCPSHCNTLDDMMSCKLHYSCAVCNPN